MLSIIVPVYNEEESLRPFYAELVSELGKLDRKYEIVFVDDGSTDSSLQILKKLEKEDESVRIFSFRRNLGKSDALTLGFQKAKGDIIITLDADLQDQPSEIEKLMKRHDEGVDVVCGWRKDRKDQSNMKIISKLFNFTLNKVFHLSIHDYNCGLKLYSKEAAKSLKLYGGMHRFIPILAYNNGFTVDEVVVRHEPRKFGVSKYKFGKIKDLPDFFTMIFLIKYMSRPLHFFGVVGGNLFGIGFVILLYLTYVKLILGEAIGGRPLLFLGILLVVVGIQIFFTGFIAELIINVTQRDKMSFPIKYQSE